MACGHRCGRQEEVNVLAGDPAVSPAVRAVQNPEADRVLVVVREPRMHRARHTLDHGGMRTWLREEGMGEDVSRPAPVSGGIVDDALTTVPDENVGIQFSRFEGHGLTDRNDAGRCVSRQVQRCNKNSCPEDVADHDRRVATEVASAPLAILVANRSQRNVKLRNGVRAFVSVQEST